MTRRFPVALAAAALLALSAPAWSADKAPSSAAEASKPGAAGLDEARALIRQGRFDEALELLAPLVEGKTVHADAAFQYGLAAMGASQQPGVSEEKSEALLDEAIGAFHAMLVRRPDLVRVRLELARAFFLKEEDRLARRHFEQVLAGEPPPAVAANVNRFLDRIRARKRWVLRVGAALAPDSNIGAGSDERFIYIHGLPFRRNQEDLTKSGVGVSIWAGGEYQYPLRNRWRLRAGADISRREYRGSDFDRMSLSTHLGPRWLIDRTTEASLLASARRHWLASEPDNREIGVRAEMRKRLTRRMSVSARMSWHDRNYEKRTHLDGSATDLSLSGSHILSPTLRANLALGWGQDRTRTERWRHERRRVRAGLTAALPWGFTVGASATMRWTDYEGNWFPFTEDGSPREDLTRSFRVNAFNRGITVGGFSPRISLVRENRSSNAQLHDYERNFGELSFVRLF